MYVNCLLTFVSSNAQCFLLTIHNCWVLYIHNRSELFPWNTFLYMYENVCNFFLLYISIKNKTNVFYALPFSHAPRRGVSWKGGTCVISLTVWHVWGNLRLVPGALWRENSRTSVSVSLHSFLGFQRPRRRRMHMYISAANHDSVNFSEHRNSSNLYLKQGSLGNINWTGVHFPT